MDVFSELPTWPLVAGLTVLMLASNEIGFRLGRRRYVSESSQTVSNTLKASVFGLVALLLGFSFSMTAGRHDLRRRVVLDEANAIGTCYLRAGLLPDADRDRIRASLRQYVAARLAYFETGHDREERQRTSAAMDRALDALWAHVAAATRANPDVVRTGLIVPAANEVIDQSGTRAWAARSHLPPPVFALLVVCVAVSSLLMGHSSGHAGRRHSGLWAALNVLLALLLFVVLDFDHPRRGLVRVDHTPLIELPAVFDRTDAQRGG